MTPVSLAELALQMHRLADAAEECDPIEFRVSEPEISKDILMPAIMLEVARRLLAAAKEDLERDEALFIRALDQVQSSHDTVLRRVDLSERVCRSVSRC